MEQFNLAETFNGLVLLAPYGAIALIALLLAELVLTLREGSGPSGKIAGGNAALGLRRFGLFVAMGIGLSGVYATGTPNFVADLTDSALYAVLLVAMLHISLFINDLVVLPSVRNSLEVRNGNVAVATVEVGGLIATGLIAKAAIAGEGGGIPATIVFFALGQLALVLAVRCYELVRKQCKIVSEVESGNNAAGLALAAKFLAYGLVIATAVGGNFTGWEHGVVSFAVTAIVGLVFLLVVDLFVDWFLMRSDNFKSMIATKNLASAFVFAGGKVGMAYVVSTLVL